MAHSFHSTVHHSIRIFLSSLLLLMLAAPTQQPALAAGEVGSGSPASCTEAAFDTALTGGGLVTFNCGPNPHTIGLSAYKQISEDTEIDGGGLITLSGNSNTNHFQVFSATNLTLRNMSLRNGKGDFGSIQNFGELVLIDSTVSSNHANLRAGGIENYGTTTLTRSTVSENSSTGSGGGILNEGGEVYLYESQVLTNTATTSGAGIYNQTNMTIVDSIINGNQAEGIDGAGIFNTGTITITRTTLAENFGYNGGGIYNSGSLQMEEVIFERNAVNFGGIGSGAGLYNDSIASGNRVMFVNNYAFSYGGGVYNTFNGSLELINSTLSHNDATSGGGLVTSGVLTMTHTTVYSNTAIYAGGVGHGVAGIGNASSYIANVTFSDNASTSGGAAIQVDKGNMEIVYGTFAQNRGAYGINAIGTGIITFLNTIVSESLAVNCAAGSSMISNGFNISSDGSCPFTNTGDHLSTNPLLGPLQDNNGYTLTHLPAAGSLAIDNGQCQNGVTNDQRGFPRPVGTSCDIGAVETGSSRLVYLPLTIR